MGIKRTDQYRCIYDQILPLVINEDIYTELLELLELYCELLLARFGLLDQAYVYIDLLLHPHSLIFAMISAQEPDPGT